jgi:hypothetical protein
LDKGGLMETRRIEIYIDGGWVESSFLTIKLKDIFRMFEPTGEQVEDNEGHTVWRVTSTEQMTNDPKITAVSVELVNYNEM